jgi:hypothetical protein
LLEKVKVIHNLNKVPQELRAGTEVIKALGEKNVNSE